jgi:hypothetical protein
LAEDGFGLGGALGGFQSFAQVIAAGRQGIEPEELVGDLLGCGHRLALGFDGRLGLSGLGEDQPEVAPGACLPFGQARMGGGGSAEVA